MPLPPDFCPVCGATVPPRARFCPECGADETTGWSESALAQRLGLPDEDSDYDEFVEHEWTPARPKPRPHIGWLWWIVAVLLVLGFFFGFAL